MTSGALPASAPRFSSPHDQARIMALAIHASAPHSDMSQAARAEIQALRLAAGILDLQHTASPQIRDLPSVQAMIRAATALFDELGFIEEGEPERTMSS